MARSRLIQSRVLTSGLKRDIRKFEDGARKAADNAAERATSVSRATFRSRLSGRPTTNLSRPKRPSTQGAFASHVNWSPKGDGHSVALGVSELEGAAPYWIIQEIGTGKSANINKGSQGTGTRAPRSVSVRRQAGRILPRGLIWSGNNPPKDQVEPRQGRPGPRVGVIRNEIKGKGYVRIGGNAGFRLYDRELEEAWRGAFGHHPKR